MIKIFLLLILALPMAAHAADPVNYKVREVAVKDAPLVSEVKKTYVDIYIKDDAIVTDLEIVDPNKIDAEVLAFIKKFNEGRVKSIPEDSKVELGAVAP